MPNSMVEPSLDESGDVFAICRGRLGLLRPAGTSRIGPGKEPARQCHARDEEIAQRPRHVRVYPADTSEAFSAALRNDVPPARRAAHAVRVRPGDVNEGHIERATGRRVEQARNVGQENRRVVTQSS